MIAQKSRRAGQSVVEFTLAAPLLVILFIGLVDFGFLLYAHVQVSHATREAARAGSLYLSGHLQYTITDSVSNTKVNCWNLDEWIEHALDEITNLNSQGCPPSSRTYSTTLHAFGFLKPGVKCPSATSGINCWFINRLEVNDVGTRWASDASDGQAGPSDVQRMTDNIGNPLLVQVRYRYEMPFLGSFIRLFDNPVVIDKTVVMKIQNN